MRSATVHAIDYYLWWVPSHCARTSVTAEDDPAQRVRTVESTSVISLPCDVCLAGSSALPDNLRFPPEKMAVLGYKVSLERHPGDVRLLACPTFVKMASGLAWTALWLTYSAFFVGAATTVNTNTTAPIVDLGYAQYQGYFDTQSSLTNFLGIRYAAPPVGEYSGGLPLIAVALMHIITHPGNLRFQAPQAPVPTSGVQPATQNPNMCYQAGFGVNTTGLVSPYGYNRRSSATPVASEDCLFLK